MNHVKKLEQLAKLIRYFILTSTTAAGSGHPTSSLSAADLMAVLFFGGFFRFDLKNPDFENNARLIFSKGHASPLFYALYAAAGALPAEELATLRRFGSRLEGHPTMEFPFTEAATGSLGQGLSVGVGMALNAKLDNLPYRTFVLLGDSEMAEGSVWEAMASAAYYKLDNLVAVLDVNRLGQRGETMYGHHTEIYEQKAKAFGWDTTVIDGHNLAEIQKAFEWAKAANPKSQIPNPKQIPNHQNSNNAKPKIIIAKTLKGKGVSFIENKDGWHGKPLSPEELQKALQELGPVDTALVGELAKQGQIQNQEFGIRNQEITYNLKLTTYNPGQPVATRKAYGNALVNLVEADARVVVLDAEVSNSTYAESVKKTHPEKFLEMFIAEQNMVGAALGLSRRGKIPFVSTFAAFFTRAFDQIRMSQYSDSNIKFVGSHAGVSIGEDGASQMALEDLAMFRSLLGGVVLYPSDAVSTEALVYLAARHQGNVYIRTTRKETPILYGIKNQELRIKNGENLIAHDFKIGGSCVLRSSKNDQATVVAAGITLHEALAAYEELQKENISIRVIDLYSIKPLDIATLEKAAAETNAIITVEDHFAEGGLGEAVASALAPIVNLKSLIFNLSVRKMPKSGKPQELLDYEEIGKDAIIKTVRQVVSTAY